MESCGLMLQMDGSPHRWFGDSTSCLIAIIDDANSELYAEFFKSETTLGCLKVLKDLISKKGVFKTLYVDRAGIFGGPKRCNFSHVQTACKELGIEIIFANSPEGKGRIERSFDTLQDRLIPELRLKSISNMDDANTYLKELFIPMYWNKELTVKPENSASEYTAVPVGKNLDDIFLIKEYRKIRNDHTFSYGNKFFLIHSSLKHSIAKQAIEIRTELDGEFKAYFANQKLEVAEVLEPTKLSLVDYEIQKKVAAIELASTLGSVSKAAKQSGVSRQTIYKNRKLLKEKGPASLKRTFNKNKHHKNRTSKEQEDAVVTFSLSNPHMGQAQVARFMKTKCGIEISPGGIRNIWLRNNIQTMALRLNKKIKEDLPKSA